MGQFNKVERPGELRFYSNGVDFVIAYNLDDARSLVREIVGDAVIDLDALGWREFGDGELYAQYLDYEPVGDDVVLPGIASEIPKGATILARAPAHSWIKHRGRCYLGSTEF